MEAISGIYKLKEEKKRNMIMVHYIYTSEPRFTSSGNLIPMKMSQSFGLCLATVMSII